VYEYAPCAGHFHIPAWLYHLQLKQIVSLHRSSSRHWVCYEYDMNNMSCVRQMPFNNQCNDETTNKWYESSSFSSSFSLHSHSYYVIVFLCLYDHLMIMIMKSKYLIIRSLSLITWQAGLVRYVRCLWLPTPMLMTKVKTM
jgi:hypothetical protein